MCAFWLGVSTANSNTEDVVIWLKIFLEVDSAVLKPWLWMLMMTAAHLNCHAVVIMTFQRSHLCWRAGIYKQCNDEHMVNSILGPCHC